MRERKRERESVCVRERERARERELYYRHTKNHAALDLFCLSRKVITGVTAQVTR